MKNSVVMPCLNEAETLASCIEKAQAWLARSAVEGEVIVTDNGSTDGSRDIARLLGARVVDVPIKGYGSALYYGCAAAQGQFIVIGDSDGSYDFSNLDPFIEKLEQGFDLVMGNRFWGGIAAGAMPWKNRYIGNPILSWVGRTLFDCPIGDFHCGLRGFSKAAFERMDLRTTGMEFASEMVIKATLLDMKITEVPTTLSKDGRSRAPHLRPWRDGWRHLRFMLLFSPRWLFLYPGLLLLGVSSLIYSLILSGMLWIGTIGFDVNTLFYAQTGIVLGLVATIFGIAARMFGMREGFLQEHSWLEAIRRSPVLEFGGIVGLSLVFWGLYLGVELLVQWGERDFGPLDVGAFLRTVSISTLLLSVGGIVTIFSLIMGFLALPTRRQKV